MCIYIYIHLYISVVLGSAWEFTGISPNFIGMSPVDIKLDAQLGLENA